MKKGLIIILIFIILNSLGACSKMITSSDLSTINNEEKTNIDIIASSTHEGYVYKERIKLISSIEEAAEVSDFFEENLHKVDILNSYLEVGFFDQYSLIIGYVNVSFLDTSISVDSVTKESNSIMVQLASNFDNDSKSLSDMVNLSYIFFIVQVDMQSIDSYLDLDLDVTFTTEDEEYQSSTYDFTMQPAYIDNISTESIYEFNDILYSGPIVKVDSVESFNLLTNSIPDSIDLDLLRHDADFFETHSYIFANYTYSAWESIVNVMGIDRQGSELQIVVSGNAPENIEGMQHYKMSKLFVIDILKTKLENIDRYKYKNYNLYNGDSRGIINNNGITETYELIDFELVGSEFGRATPFSIYNIISVNELQEIQNSWRSSTYDDISYLNNYTFDEDFFADNQLLVLPLSYRSSDSNVQVFEIRNYGSYYEIITTTDNSEFNDQTYGIYNEVFIISISRDLSSENIYLNSMVYLGDE